MTRRATFLHQADAIRIVLEKLSSGALKRHCGVSEREAEMLRATLTEARANLEDWALDEDDLREWLAERRRGA